MAGLAAATLWILAGMDRVVGSALPAAPSREAFLSVFLDPDYLSIAVRVSEGVKIALVTAIAALAVHRARNMVRAHAAAEAERARVQQIFGRYVPAQVAEQLIHSGQLAPHQREASIIFCDIEGFTRMSESLQPAELIQLLNSFFSAATAIIDERGGVVVNHVGDALIAAFNAPLPVDGHAGRAVDAARALLSVVSGRDFEGTRLRVRVGVATGLGCCRHRGWRRAPDLHAVRRHRDIAAQRLEELNKELGTNCLICGTTFKAAELNCADAAPMGPLQVRGREGAVEVFALGGKPTHIATQ